MRLRLDILTLLAGLAALPALAQTGAQNGGQRPVLPPSAPPSSQSLNTAPGCEPHNTAQPATGPAPASRDGTAPGNAGSTGWTGGIGGSQIGTNASGALPSSPTFQPRTARGLDPIAAPVAPERVC